MPAGQCRQPKVHLPPRRSPPQAERGRKRLNFLLKQAEVFQHFAPATVERERKKRGGRHGTGRTEEQEDEELLRDEEGGAEQAGHRLQVQPSVITGGKLREYQIQGLNWLIHLYDNGINGILADEMVRLASASPHYCAMRAAPEASPAGGICWRVTAAGAGWACGWNAAGLGSELALTSMC